MLSLLLPNSMITQKEAPYLCTTVNEKIIPDPNKGGSKQELQEVYINHEKVLVEKKEDFYFVQVKEQNALMLVQIFL